MPLSGTVSANVIYTLSKDCVLTGNILVSGALAADGHVKVTINGGGNTIKLDNSNPATPLFRVQADPNWTSTLNLNNLTIDLEDLERLQALVVNGALNLSEVTLAGLKGYYGSGSTHFIFASGTSSKKASVSFNKVLAADNSSSGYSHLDTGNILRLEQTIGTFHDVVIRNNYWAAAAVSVGSGSSLTATGCLTFSGVIPRNVKGSWTGSDRPVCSGRIGNKGEATLAAPTSLPCGLHSTRNFDQNASYNLRGDCVIAGTYNLSQGVTVRINGYGHSITSDVTNPATFHVANEAALMLENIISENVAYVNFGTLTGNRIHARNSSRGTVIDNPGTADFTQSKFSDNVGWYSGAVALADNAYDNGATSFTDVIFERNTSTSASIGGGAAIQRLGAPASITLSGCITFKDNSPADTLGTIIDNRTGPCGEDDDAIGPGPRTIPPSPGGPPAGPKEPNDPHSASATDDEPPRCSIPLGAIGIICRGKVKSEPILEVWEISPQSVGSFALRIRQSQVETAGEGIIVCSENGRSVVRAGPLPPPEALEIWRWDPRYSEEINTPRTYITVSMGPTFEGKIHHVIFDHTLEGRVLSTVDSYGRLEGCAAEASAPSQRNQLQNCMVTLTNILNFRAGPAGEIVSVLPQNVTLTALERTDGWFKVDYHGERGWVSADYVTPVGDCG